MNIARCCSNINDLDNSIFPLTIGKGYHICDEDLENYWVEDDTGIIEHYWKELFIVDITT